MGNRRNIKIITISFGAMIYLLAIIYGYITIENRTDDKQVIKDADKLQTYTYSTVGEIL